MMFHASCAFHRLTASAFVLCMLSCVSFGLRAQDRPVAETSLAMVPSDAAFYSSSIQLRESMLNLTRSSFARRLRNVPFIVQLEGELLRQWETPDGQLAQARDIIQSPTAMNLIRLAEDMFASEFFVYGGDGWCESLEEMMKVQREIASLGDAGEAAVMDYIYGLTKEDLDRFRIPTTVIGFRLTDDDNARVQLDALEGILRYGLGNVDGMRDFVRRLRRTDFNQGQSLSLTLDTTLMPEVQLNEPEQQELAEHLLELMEGRRLTVEVGVNQGVMLVVISEAGGMIKTFGSPQTSLLDHDALAPLRAQQPLKLRAISYASQRWRESQWYASYANYFGNFVSQFASAVRGDDEELTEDQEDWLAELEQDAEELDGQLQEMSPDFGPLLAWSYAADNSLEGYVYDWNQGSVMENANPLSIVRHAGTSALAFQATNSQTLQWIEDFVAMLLEKVPAHLRRFIEIAETEDADREKALRAVDGGWPLLEEAFGILTQQIAPAVGSQTVISMAAGWTVQELPELPPAPRPLPLPEVAAAWRLQDRDMFINGCARLYEVMDQLVDLLRQIDPNSVPPGYVIPRPDEEALANGTRYFYSVLAEQFPIEGFEPQVLVGDDLVVVGFSSRQIDEMVIGGAAPIIAGYQPGQPVAAARVLDLAGIFKAIRPWAEYAFLMSPVGLDTPVAEADGPIPTGSDLLQMWDALSYFGRLSGTTTVSQDGATVGRWSWQFVD
jgi:hypothetical protein